MTTHNALAALSLILVFACDSEPPPAPIQPGPTTPAVAPGTGITPPSATPNVATPNVAPSTAESLLPPGTMTLMTINAPRILQSPNRTWATSMATSLTQSPDEASQVPNLETALTGIGRILIPFDGQGDEPFFVLVETAKLPRQLLSELGESVDDCVDINAAQTLAIPALATRATNAIRCGGDGLAMNLDGRFLIVGGQPPLTAALQTILGAAQPASNFPTPEGTRLLSQIDTNAMVTVVGTHNEWSQEFPGVAQLAASLDFMDAMQIVVATSHTSAEAAASTTSKFNEFKNEIRGALSELPGGAGFTAEVDAMQAVQTGNDVRISAGMSSARVQELLQLGMAVFTQF